MWLGDHGRWLPLRLRAPRGALSYSPRSGRRLEEVSDAYLAVGDLERACATTLRALADGALIRSGRCVNYLRDFRQQLTRAADAAAVTDFSEQARESRLWQIASRPDKAAA